MQAPTLEEVYTRPKSKSLFDRVRAHILEGVFPPGHWLKQAELEDRYAASRSEVRAALSSLADRGVVEYVHNRGFRVYDRSPQEINDIIEMIMVLEGAAADSMVQRVDEAAMANLTDLAEQFDALIAGGSHADLRLLNYRFHSELNALGANALMARTIQNLRECCISGPFGRYTTYQGLSASAAEHFGILEALKTRDGKRLAKLLRDHSSHTS